MDDAWTPAEQHAGEFWSAQACGWVTCDEAPPPTVELPQPREAAEAEQPAHA